MAARFQRRRRPLAQVHGLAGGTAGRAAGPIGSKKIDSGEEAGEEKEEQQRQSQQAEYRSRVRVDEDGGVKKAAWPGRESERPAMPKGSPVGPSWVEV